MVGNPRVKRTRSVEAIFAVLTETTVVAIASSWQEDCIAVWPGEQTSVYAVMVCPFISAVIIQFLHFLVCRHTPKRTHIDICSIIACFEDCQVVGKTIVTIFRIATILCKSIFTSVTILVCVPVVGVFLFCFTPSIVVAVVFGVGCTHICISPVCFAWQSKVNVCIAV